MNPGVFFGLDLLGRKQESYMATGSRSSDEQENERSPLLRAMRQSYHEDSLYQTIPTPHASYMSSDNTTTNDAAFRGMRVFRPIIHAEKALGVLVNSVIIYAFCCILGLGLISLNADGVLGSRDWNWWLVFMPFWVGNVIMFVAHVLSMRSSMILRQWAETDCMSNEPLLPLLRKILLIYAMSVPLMLLLFWSELAFCAILSETAAPTTSVYVAFGPILFIEVAFIFRYILCKARSSTLPVQPRKLIAIINIELPSLCL